MGGDDWRAWAASSDDLSEGFHVTSEMSLRNTIDEIERHKRKETLISEWKIGR